MTTLGPPIRIRYGRRGIAAAGYSWATLGPMSPDAAAMPDAIAVLIVADADPDDGRGWVVVRRTRRRVLVVNDPAGWRAHEG